MFEKASRLKIRFETEKGIVTVEDLWDLPLTENGALNKLAKSLSRKIKESEEESFVVKKSSSNNTLTFAFDIVKHVIEVRMAEAEASKNKAAKKAEKEKLLSILAAKEAEDLNGKSKAEIEEMIAAMEA